MSEKTAEHKDMFKTTRVADGKRFVAFENIPMEPVIVIGDEYTDERIGAYMTCPTLRDNYDKAAVDSAVGRLIKSVSGGSALTQLFIQQTEEGQGMSLLHAWFGPNLRVYSHSHPAKGDCLYYIIGGEVIMGSKRLGAGSVMFAPKGKSYSVLAGPAGVEFLEFHAANPEADKPMDSINEKTLASVEEIITHNESNKPQWQRPERIGDVAFLQREYDAQQSYDSKPS